MDHKMAKRGGGADSPFIILIVAVGTVFMLTSTTNGWTVPLPSLRNTNNDVGLPKSLSCIQMIRSQEDKQPQQLIQDHDVSTSSQSTSSTKNILQQSHYNRRRILSSTIGPSVAILTIAAVSTATTTSSFSLFSPQPAWALVKGVSPPSSKNKSGSDNKPKCTNVEECQAMAEQRETEQRQKEEAGPPPLVTATGVKYRDLEDGQVDSISAMAGDLVSVYFKVLKLGKRSYDGLSGEGTV
jgi:hypothetical protein